MAAPTLDNDEIPLLPPPAQAFDEEEHGPPSFESEFPRGYYQPRPQIFSQSQTQPVLPTSTQATNANAPADTGSILPPYSASKYGRHKNEDEYLAALRAWAEEKTFATVDPRGGLTGFYGAETMDERKAKLNEERRLRKMRKMSESAARGSSGAGDAQGGEQKQRRKSSIGNWLKRRASTAV